MCVRGLTAQGVPPSKSSLEGHTREPEHAPVFLNRWQLSALKRVKLSRHVTLSFIQKSASLKLAIKIFLQIAAREFAVCKNPRRN